ncbi:hypothetical protein LOTGIDRAFT_162377 [Lottia gigantea]|uniref:Uncharacterized protein n=1 Tax=Lottia gigantea TaxID=225164 RepID=V3ZNE5_LOTGI|nr:hypothetical protein LOTGIDRAFT_162377 [Lottia gigantea]ESO92898.1 hypothetical protein LOTGIDRAFT_162377 [Lottia gigantea]
MTIGDFDMILKTESSPSMNIIRNPTPQKPHTIKIYTFLRRLDFEYVKPDLFTSIDIHKSQQDKEFILFSSIIERHEGDSNKEVGGIYTCRCSIEINIEKFTVHLNKINDSKEEISLVSVKVTIYTPEVMITDKRKIIGGGIDIKIPVLVPTVKATITAIQTSSCGLIAIGYKKKTEILNAYFNKLFIFFERSREDKKITIEELEKFNEILDEFEIEISAIKIYLYGTDCIDQMLKYLGQYDRKRITLISHNDEDLQKKWKRQKEITSNKNDLQHINFTCSYQHEKSSLAEWGKSSNIPVNLRKIEDVDIVKYTEDNWESLRHEWEPYAKRDSLCLGSCLIKYNQVTKEVVKYVQNLTAPALSFKGWYYLYHYDKEMIEEEWYETTRMVPKHTEKKI